MNLDRYDGGFITLLLRTRREALFSCGQGAKLNETVENRCLSAF
jgi:hypothetical protein